MVNFILNNKEIKTSQPEGMTLLDFIRMDQGLKGTKITCREGDCGACTVLVGEIRNGKIEYRSIVSCLSPLGAVHGKHVVSIEGLNTGLDNPILDFLYEENASQCGFCSPGIVLALTEGILREVHLSEKDLVAGNICRCTGYKSIERALAKLDHFKKKNGYKAGIDAAIRHLFIPEYFKGILSRLEKIDSRKQSVSLKVIGGGTDLYVHNADDLYSTDLYYILDDEEINSIQETDSSIIIGAGCTTSRIMESNSLQELVPSLVEDFKLISSEQIRNSASIGGNIVNASPIGDLSIYFLALDAKVHIRDYKKDLNRVVNLKDFFLDYKRIDLKESEIIKEISVSKSQLHKSFNFEKVCKRKHLDIASVNTACSIKFDEREIKQIHLSAGGVAPIPLVLKNTEVYLQGKQVNAELLFEAAEILAKEISPISDVRGSAEYKRILLQQLFFSHFEVFFPGILKSEQVKAFYHEEH